MKASVLTLTLMSLLVLPACSTRPVKTETVIVEKIVKAVPPGDLLEECTLPALRVIKKNRDLVADRQEWRKAALVCSTRKKKLNEWVKTPLN